MAESCSLSRQGSFHVTYVKDSQRDVGDLHHPWNTIYIIREHAPIWDIEVKAAAVIVVSWEAHTTVASAN